MPRVNKSKFAILGVLSFRPMSAYGIKTFMQNTTQYFWSESEAQIYPTIKKLHTEKLLTAREEKAAKAGTKKIYTITKAGQKVLQEWLKQRVYAIPYRNERLLKIFFGINQSAKDNIALLEHWLAEIKLEQKLIQENKAMLQERKLTKKDKCYPMLTIEYGLELLAAEERWCKQSIKTIQNL